MKKKLSVVEIILAICAALLPFVDGMFTWITSTMFRNVGKTEMSLDNLMTTQQLCGGPYIFWIFNLLLLIMIIYCIIDIFKPEMFEESKKTIIIPAITFIIGTTMIFSLDGHSESFVWKSELRYVNISLNALAYMELILLAGILLIEIYKKYKCKEQ